jgi:hypothetical protein
MKIDDLYARAHSAGNTPTTYVVTVYGGDWTQKQADKIADTLNHILPSLNFDFKKQKGKKK